MEHDYLICPSCYAIETPPYDEGDECLCGSKFVDSAAVRKWHDVFCRVGSVVAAARMQRASGGHHLAVYGAIGKCLIDWPEFDRFDKLLQERES